MSVCGIVLAAGAGVRFGGPKALARDENGIPWTERAVATLREAGCAPVLVCLGAERAAASPLVPQVATIVEVPDWHLGLSASVKAGLRVAAQTDASAALIVPVDVPELPASVCRRVLDAATPDSEAALCRAVYSGRPGHPALIGRVHWVPVAAELVGDRGAGAYLTSHGATAIECGDLWHGRDVDVRVALTEGSSPLGG
ncbi:MAG: nucleotidyltransferase family protein [Microbacterium sp.]